MKLKFGITVFSALVLSTVADAHVTSVTLLDAHEQVYLVTAQACPGAFQSIDAEVTKIGNDAALVSLTESLSVEHCADQQLTVTFEVPIKQELEAASLNPDTAKIYFRLQ